MLTRLRAIVSRLVFLLARQGLDEDLRLEIDTHLDSLTEHYRRQGMSSDQAYSAARRQFGSTALLRQDIREMNGIAWLEHTVQDLRHASRQLLRSPAFTGIVIVTLALGIGSTTAIFSVVEAVLLRPLPYPEANRLVRIIERSAESANDIGYQQSLAAVWTRDLPVLRALAPTLSPVGVYSSAAATVVIAQGNSARLDGTRLSPSVFEMLGARPALGRIFLPTEEAPSTEPVVVLSHSMWQQYFGGQPDVLGRKITVDDKVFTIVGVMPQAFQFPDADTRFWSPYILDGRMARVAPIARIADGVGIEAASANVEAALQQIRKTEPRVPSRSSSWRRSDL
jgi:putative ABC transport system permease protein